MTTLTPNEDLMSSKGITGERKALLEDVYSELDGLLSRPEMFSDTPKQAVEQVRHLESQMQRLWGFMQDSRWFYYEFYLKGCTCPKLDNEDLKGHTHVRYLSLDCPIHQGESWE